MEDAFIKFLDRVTELPSWIAYTVLLLSSGLEYVFPPFPGDSVTLFAAILIGARGWSFPGVFLAINAGSVAGAIADYAAGRWLGAPGRQFRQWGPRWEKFGRVVDRIARGFERHGVLYLTVNRFFPSIRAFFFIAAGVARFPFWKVVTFGLLSSVLWNALILVLGLMVEYNLEKLKPILSNYSFLLWTALILAVAVYLYRCWRRGRRAKPAED
ncbi:MAG: DedA family protein [Planctomycetes bacterium]|nr:DedA family protein [Planctomycetota bacterium]